MSKDDTVILDEDYDPNYVPTEAEITEYAEYIGINLKDPEEAGLIWIAKEGLKSPLPSQWKPCRSAGDEKDDVYYFNFETGESSWEHPCDEFYKKLFQDEKKKLLTKKPSKRPSQKLAPLRSTRAPEVKKRSSEKLNPLRSPQLDKRGIIGDVGGQITEELDICLDSSDDDHTVDSDDVSDDLPKQSDMVRDLLNSSLKEIAPRASLKELKDIPRPIQQIPEQYLNSRNSSPTTKPPHPTKRDAAMTAEKRKAEQTRQRNKEYEIKAQEEAYEFEIIARQQKHQAHLTALAQSHKTEIKDICMEHAGEVQHLKTESRSRMGTMEMKVKEAAANISELEKRHRRDIERIKEEHELVMSQEKTRHASLMDEKNVLLKNVEAKLKDREEMNVSLEALKTQHGRRTKEWKSKLEIMEATYAKEREELQRNHQEQLKKFRLELKTELKESQELHKEALTQEEEQFLQQRKKQREKHKEEIERITAEQDHAKKELKIFFDEKFKAFRHKLENDFVFKRNSFREDTEQRLNEQRVVEHQKLKTKLDSELMDLEREHEAKTQEIARKNRKDIADLEIECQEQLSKFRAEDQKKRESIRTKLKSETQEYLEVLRNEERSAWENMRIQSQQKVRDIQDSVKKTLNETTSPKKDAGELADVKGKLKEARAEIDKLNQRLRSPSTDAEEERLSSMEHAIESKRVAESRSRSRRPSRKNTSTTEASDRIKSIGQQRSDDLWEGKLEGKTLPSSHASSDSTIMPAIFTENGFTGEPVVAGYTNSELDKRLKYEYDIVTQGHAQVHEQKRRVKKMSKKLEAEQRAWRKRRDQVIEYGGDKKIRLKRSLEKQKRVLDEQAITINRDVALVKEMKQLLEKKERQLSGLSLCILKNQLATPLEQLISLIQIPQQQNTSWPLQPWQNAPPRPQQPPQSEIGPEVAAGYFSGLSRPSFPNPAAVSSEKRASNLDPYNFGYSSHSLHSLESPMKLHCHSSHHSLSHPMLDVMKNYDDSAITNSSVGQLMRRLREPIPTADILQHNSAPHSRSQSMSRPASSLRLDRNRSPAANEVIIRVKVETGNS